MVSVQFSKQIENIRSGLEPIKVLRNTSRICNIPYSHQHNLILIVKKRQFTVRVKESVLAAPTSVCACVGGINSSFASGSGLAEIKGGGLWGDKWRRPPAHCSTTRL